MKKLFLLFAVVFCTNVCANAQLKAISFPGEGNSGENYEYNNVFYIFKDGYMVDAFKAGQTYTVRRFVPQYTQSNEKALYWILAIGLNNNSYFYGSVDQITFTLPSSSQPYTISIYLRTNITATTKYYTVQP